MTDLSFHNVLHIDTAPFSHAHNDTPSHQASDDANATSNYLGRVRKYSDFLNDESGISTTLPATTEDNPQPKRRLQARVSVVVPMLAYPKPLYVVRNPSEPRLAEADILSSLLAEFAPGEDKYISLSNFCAYRDLQSSLYPGTLVPMSDLLTRHGTQSLMFDGTLAVGSKKLPVQGIRFNILSVEGYDVDVTSVRSNIYIQSTAIENSNVWYKLGRPAQEYSQYHEAYLWVADFGKHFVCYLLTHENVTLQCFKSRFHRWLQWMYSHSKTFRDWFQRYNRRDFRSVVARHFEYLWKESTSLGTKESNHVRKHVLWKEIDPEQLNAVPFQPYSLDAKTPVTPYVYDLFKHLYFGDQLSSTEPVKIIDNNIPASTTNSTFDMLPVSYVNIGDIVGLERDAEGHWKDKEPIWFAYVHDIEQLSDGQQQLHVFWVYRPSETTCGSMKYPFPNELFLSDHCNCTCGKASRILSTDVKGKLSVSLFSSSAEVGRNYFIRSTYITEDDSNHFITLDRSHLKCAHRRPAESALKTTYHHGDTVLIRALHDSLEPVVFIRWQTEEKVEVRKFLRRGRDYDHAAAFPNELVYTNTIITVAASSIIRKCHVRCYSGVTSQDQIPSPYNLGGIGDCWVVTHRVAAIGELIPMDCPDFAEGFDPEKPEVKPLSTLDLFCGSGSFGRGLEQGNATVVKWAVDIDKYAIHTKRANLANTNQTALYLGSASQYFLQAASNRFSHLVAALNMVEMIIAGSPCQGFSMLQPDKDSSRSRLNASMVALVVAFIDLYRPKYALLENVFGMMAKLGPNKNEDVFAQIVCALVGMGYQVRYYSINAFCHGSPQARSRIFISVAAAGLTPIECPPVTHKAPDASKRRGLGRSLAGVSFGNQIDEPTPFKYISAQKATQDLPDIGNASIGICVEVPDHHPRVTMGLRKKLLVRHIPRFPRGQGFLNVVNKIPDAVFDTFERRMIRQNVTRGRVWQRVRPGGVFDTITTAPKSDDLRNGRWLHWTQHREVSLMEARRAQGFRDDVVLIGRATEQWKLVGNAVCFNVSTALGLSLRMALVKDAKLYRSLKDRKLEVTERNDMTTVIRSISHTSKKVELRLMVERKLPPASDTDSNDPLTVAGTSSKIFSSSSMVHSRSFDELTATRPTEQKPAFGAVCGMQLEAKTLRPVIW